MQAGRRGEGRGGEPGGGGGEAGEASPLRGGHAGTGWLRGIPACPALGAPAQPRRECPFLARQLGGSPPARRWRGLICIEVTGTRPIAAPPSGPGNFQKAHAGQQPLCAPERAEKPAGISCVQPGTAGPKAACRFQPRFLASVVTPTAPTPAPLRGRGQRGAPSWSGPVPPSGELEVPGTGGRRAELAPGRPLHSAREGRGLRACASGPDALPGSLTGRPGSRQLLATPPYRSHPITGPTGLHDLWGWDLVARDPGSSPSTTTYRLRELGQVQFQLEPHYPHRVPHMNFSVAPPPFPCFEDSIR